MDKCFEKVARVSTSSWGSRYRALRIIYFGTYVATVTYAASVWCGRVGFYVVKSRLLRTQRPALILLTKAYRTTSTAALAVLAGVLPADLEVRRTGKVEASRGGLAGREVTELRKVAYEEALDAWQERWDAEERGSDLKRFFPSVRGRLGATWVEPDYVVSQLLTGHGAFRERLWALGLSDSAECSCGELESRDHVLWDCEMYEQERSIMLAGLERKEAGPVYFADLVSSEANFARLQEFACAWHRRRRMEETEQ